MVDIAGEFGAESTMFEIFLSDTGINRAGVKVHKFGSEDFTFF